MKFYLVFILSLISFIKTSQAQFEPIINFQFNENAIDSKGQILEVESTSIEYGDDRYGNKLSAARFNGSNSTIKVPFDINANKYPSMTIAAWVKAGSKNRIMNVISIDNGGYDRSLAIDNRDRGWKWSAFCGNKGVKGGLPVVLDKWTFVAVIYDGQKKSITLFVDGISFEQTAQFNLGLPYFNIGSNPSFGKYFHGSIDDLRIFDSALPLKAIEDIFISESKDIIIPKAVRQFYYEENGDLADVLVRVGDIDNLGFGWPKNFDPFCGASTPVHPYPWKNNPLDYPGTDRITVGTSFGNARTYTDGYTNTTNRNNNRPTPIKIEFPPPKIPIEKVIIQFFVDDFQAPAFGSYFQVYFDQKRISYIEKVLNSINQTGPIGKLITLGLLPEDIELLQDGKLDVFIDDPLTNVGDGFAIDFIRILINPKNEAFCSGTIKGTVVDQDRNPVSNALVSNGGMNEVVTDQYGNFLIEDVPAGLANINAEKYGYTSDSKMLDILNGSIQQVKLVLKKQFGESKEFIVNELNRTGFVNLYGIYFDTDKDKPKSNSTQTLNSLLQALQENPSLKILISGHTDSDGSREYNQSLSERRAKSIASWLNKNGISQSRLNSVGLGESSPVASNTSTEGKALNRRVEIEIMK